MQTLAEIETPESTSGGQQLEPLAPKGYLDYSKHQIVMEAGGPIERSYRLHACEKEPWTVEFIEAIPQGSWFVDIGASTGPYTLIALANEIKVVAIEPAFESYRRLCRNLAHNGALDKAIVLCCALASGFGYDWYHYRDIRAGAGSNMFGGDRKITWHRQLIPTWTLDMVCNGINGADAIYIKMDVDGAEDGVLAGGMETLVNPRVRGLMLEIPRVKEASITAMLTETGWQLLRRVDNRNGVQIGEIVYLWMTRG